MLYPSTTSPQVLAEPLCVLVIFRTDVSNQLFGPLELKNIILRELTRAWKWGLGWEGRVKGMEKLVSPTTSSPRPGKPPGCSRNPVLVGTASEAALPLRQWQRRPNKAEAFRAQMSPPRWQAVPRPEHACLLGTVRPTA